ncbi:hypothetical protein [Paenibacillus protaetiae]|uniref:Uncharacterized protein n=1 Tax=Paenibacillus protaetiae TaxID=2509456 RepID=A0A4P6EXM3_9BACL|nr:hypothetical protein [Paenibacillus protaetiae]QAY67536.1 hypothetical protein ET464_15210 [Paenibacillus protaetiae]
MDYIIEFIKGSFPNTTEAILAVVFLILVAWMYKELRASYIENNKSDQQRLDKALDSYSELDLEIYKYIQDKSDLFSVIEKVSKSVVFLPTDLLKQYDYLKRIENDNELKEVLKEFQQGILKEISRLKFKQVDTIVSKNESVK